MGMDFIANYLTVVIMKYTVNRKMNILKYYNEVYVHIVDNLEFILRIGSILILQRIICIIEWLEINSNDSRNFSPFLTKILNHITLWQMLPMLNRLSGD
jgi:hypothetical protein